MVLLGVYVCAASLFLVFGQRAGATYRALYTSDRKLVQEFVNTDGVLLDCGVFADSLVVEEILSQTDDDHQYMVNSEEFNLKVKTCHDFLLQETSSPSARLSRHKRNILKGIYPGTKWCGRGDVAGNDDSLGTLVKEDSCCRTHDKCTPQLKKGETKYGITNDGSATVLSCACDRAFYKCLKKVGTPHAMTLGSIYFDMLPSKCIEVYFGPFKCIKKTFFNFCYPSVKFRLIDFPDSYLTLGDIVKAALTKPINVVKDVTTTVGCATLNFLTGIFGQSPGGVC